MFADGLSRSAAATFECIPVVYLFNSKPLLLDAIAFVQWTWCVAHARVIQLSQQIHRKTFEWNGINQFGATGIVLASHAPWMR